MSRKPCAVVAVLAGMLLAVFAALPAAATLASPVAPAWLGHRGYDYTHDLVAFGPRPPGTAAHAKTEAFILEHLRRDGARIESDAYTAHTSRGPFAERNIIAKFGPEAGDILIVASHYDTKFLPHFVGADDGGSSTGLLLAIADVLAEQKPSVPVWLVFLDGEESVKVQWDDADSLFGSRHLARKFQAEGLVPRIRGLILLDMIGNKGVRIERDTNSTRWLQDFVAAAARRLGYASYFFQISGPIEDDHQPFLAVGIPSVDLIDLTYRYWHTPQDTMDKLSPRSFQIVGAVTLETLRMLAAQS